MRKGNRVAKVNDALEIYFLPAFYFTAGSLPTINRAATNNVMTYTGGRR